MLPFTVMDRFPGNTVKQLYNFKRFNLKPLILDF